MKMTPVKEVPGKTGHYCNLQGGGAQGVYGYGRKSREAGR